jgi:hypothetical protein
LTLDFTGQFQDIPDVPPAAQNVFQYSIADNEWSIIKTIGDTVTRPAEGSTTVVPGEGAGGDNLGFYFSGHLDDHTVGAERVLSWSARELADRFASSYSGSELVESSRSRLPFLARTFSLFRRRKERYVFK